MLPAGRLLMGTLIISCVTLLPTNSLAALMSTGDIAFIGFNTDDADDFAIVLLADAAASDIVRFNDNEWLGSAFDKNNEGEISWAVGTTLAAGTVVTFSSMRTSPSASAGSLAGGNMSLSAGETIYAFLGVNAETPSTFLAAVSNDPAHYGDEMSTATLTGTGLTQGSTAILLPGSGSNLADGGQYTGARTGQGDFADYLTLIGSTSTNWDVDLSDGGQFVPFNSTAFQASNASVPEPGSLTLMVLAAMMGAVRYRHGAGKRSRSSATHE